MKCRLFPLIFLVVLPLFLKGQYNYLGQPYISHFEKSDYQAGTQNWVILQSRNGIMYFGNNSGLLEFDGVNWNTFRLPNRTIVRSLAEDSNGRIYLGGQGELGYLDRTEKGAIYFHSLLDIIPKEQHSFEDVWKIFEIGESIFFCTQKAIYRYREEKMEVFSATGQFRNYFENEGRLLVRDTERGLLEFSDKRFKTIVGGGPFKSIETTAILSHKSQNQLIITSNSGLYLLNDNGIQAWDIPFTQILKKYTTYCAIELVDGNYAIGTTRDGLLIIDQNGVLLNHITKDAGLQNNTVLSVFQDEELNLWLGLDNGIDYVEVNTPFSLVRGENGIEGTGYASKAYKGKLYLGTNQGLYSIDLKKQAAFRAGQFDFVNSTSGQVWSLNLLEDELIVGQHKGASLIQDNSTYEISSINGAWKFLQLAKNKNYALEGTYSGLLLYEKQNSRDAKTKSKWKFIKKLVGFDESARIMEEDDEGNIWVSHFYKGLYKIELDLENRSIKDINLYNSNDGLPSDISINVSKIKNQVVFTTTEGVYYYDGKSSSFHKHQELNELLGEKSNIHRLLEDELGNIWFSVNDEFGILKINQEGIYNKVEKKYFNHIQDHLTDGYEQVHAIDSSNILIATENGYINYFPLKENNASVNFKVLLREVTTSSPKDSIIFSGNFSNEELTPSSDFPLEFPANVNNIRFAFSAPYYEQIKEVLYRFRLEGFKEDWSSWSKATDKEYTNLAYGDYRFVVEAKNAYNQISEPCIIAFTIQTPWFQTLFAKVVFTVLGLLFLFGLLYNGTIRLKKKTAELETKQALEIKKKEKLFQQEAEKSEAEIIRLRNEKLRSDINHKNSELASATMHLVQKREVLQKIKKDLEKIKSNPSGDNRTQISKLIRAIDGDIQLDDNWNQFEVHFDQVHESFLKRLRQNYPALTPKDQKLCAYLRMNLTTKEIAPLMNISVRGVEVSRYRLRKKLDLDSETNLVSFILKL